MTATTLPAQPVRPAVRIYSPTHALLWAATMALLVLAPLVFDSSASLTFLTQLGTLIVLALSYNMLFGQAGMLSFGHAVYSGLGAYFSVHAMNLAAAQALPVPLPVVFVPVVGGVAGMLFGVIFGWLNTKRSGTAFAMITMGICELVFALSHMFPKFFGGDGGISTNRSYGEPWFGLTFGSQIQVYYLTVAWLLMSIALMYGFTRTPLGRLANAVRDNAERVEFIGYNPHRIRYLTLVLSSFFAGISGALMAINFEIVGAESLSVVRSGDGLLFTFIGGAGSFVGPIMGAVLGGLLTIKLSDFSMAWQLYLGLVFIGFVMYGPLGMVGIAMSAWRIVHSGRLARVLPYWLVAIAAGAVTVAGIVILVELAYAHTFGPQKAVIAVQVQAIVGGSTLVGWILGLVLFAAGVTGLRRARRAMRDALEEQNALHPVPPRSAK
jgi:branched-chain amino acid transport system permease protein